MNVFPSLPGLAWSVSKTPSLATRVQRSVSGRELRLNDQPTPIWDWTLTYSLLRDQWDVRGGTGPGSGYDELRTLMGFFLQQQGAYQPFLFDDPTDDRVVGQYLGTGNSSTATWQLVRTMGASLAGGGFSEPILAPNTVSNVYLNGIVQSPSNYSVNSGNGELTFDTPPTGQVITADFTYYFRVRFSADTAAFENFMWQLWQAKQIKLTSVLN